MGAKELNQFIVDKAKPLWDRLLADNPQAKIDEQTIYLGVEEMTFQDFCEDIRLRLS